MKKQVVLNNIRGKHMDFEVLEMEKNSLLMDSSRTTIVALDETLQTFRQNPEVQKHLIKIQDVLADMSKSGETQAGIFYTVSPWIADFQSEMVSDREGLKITYTVNLRGDSFDKADLSEVEDAIYKMIEEVELLMKSEFNQIQELTGKEVHII